MVHVDAILWDKDIMKAHMQYEDPYSSAYWNNPESWKHGTLSALGRFVPYDCMCCCNLTETSRDWSLALISDNVTA